MSELDIELKFAIHKICEEKVDEMISQAQWRMDQVQEAANEEVKSSMGDKFETTRAMMQREKEQAAQQLEECLKLKEALSKAHVNSIMDSIASGAVIVTNFGNFYLAAAVGKFTFENVVWYGVSTVSPIGQKLLGLKLGDSFELNGRTFKIEGLI